MLRPRERGVYPARGLQDNKLTTTTVVELGCNTSARLKLFWFTTRRRDMGIYSLHRILFTFPGVETVATGRRFTKTATGRPLYFQRMDQTLGERAQIPLWKV